MCKHVAAALYGVGARLDEQPELLFRLRGVDAGGVVQTLLDRGLVRIAGRAELPGRPLLYATTPQFLEHFGLKDVKELPAFEELRLTLLAKEESAPAGP